LHIQPLHTLNADCEALLRTRAEERGRDAKSNLDQIRDALAARKIKAVCLYDDADILCGITTWRWVDSGQVYAQVLMLYLHPESPPALSEALVDYVFSELARVRTLEVIEVRVRDETPGVRQVWQRHDLVLFERCRMARPLGVTPLPIVPVPGGYRIARWQDEFQEQVERIAIAAHQDGIDAAAVPDADGNRMADNLHNLWAEESDRCNAEASPVVLDKRGRVSGYIAVSSTGGEALVVDLAIQSAHRRRGLARLLMVRCLTVCQQQGLSVVRLAVTTRNPARQLFNQLGFRATDCGEVAIWWRDGRQLRWRA
jgi:ribosomal protein S18 acetylase RimI-like enzyme